MTREVWHYKDSNDDLIRRAINLFNWKTAFENENIDEKILALNKTIFNIISDNSKHNYSSRLLNKLLNVQRNSKLD